MGHCFRQMFFLFILFGYKACCNICVGPYLLVFKSSHVLESNLEACLHANSNIDKWSSFVLSTFAFPYVKSNFSTLIAFMYIVTNLKWNEVIHYMKFSTNTKQGSYQRLSIKILKKNVPGRIRDFISFRMQIFIIT